MLREEPTIWTRCIENPVIKPCLPQNGKIVLPTTRAARTKQGVPQFLIGNPLDSLKSARDSLINGHKSTWLAISSSHIVALGR